MPQSGYTPLKIYSSSTPTNVPNASNLVNDTGGSELAINTYDEKLYFKNSSGVVKLLASVASTGGIYSSVTITGGTMNGVTGTNSGMTVGTASTSTTQSLGDNTTKIATTAFVQNTIQTLYPVGSIYTSTVSTNPATLFGFGTWVSFGAGRVMIGQDGSSFIAGATGGSADAVVVNHTHSATSTVTDPGHSHAGLHTPVSANNPGPYVGWYGCSSVVDVNTSSAVTGITVATTNTSTGVSATNANLQPYIVVYMWNRTA